MLVDPTQYIGIKKGAIERRYYESLSNRILSRTNISKYVNYIKCSIFALIGIKLALTDR